MKIAIVGCGAVGSYYGAMLCRAGQDVHFLLRSDYDAVRQQGVLIHNADGDFRVRPNCAKSPDEIGVSDLAIIALKTTANDEFPRLLPPLVGPKTAVLTLQNGLGNEENLSELFPGEQILGGLCFICLNRIAPGVIQHKAHGQIVLGEFQRASRPRTHEIASIFRSAGVACKVTDNLASAHWEKLVWNIPFNGLGVASTAGLDSVLSGRLPAGRKLAECLTTDKLLSDVNWESLVRELMHEIIFAARRLGLNLSEEIAEKQIIRTRAMGAYKASTLVDFERGQPLELKSLFLEPLRQAQNAGIDAPRLAALCEVLKQLDKINQSRIEK